LLHPENTSRVQSLLVQDSARIDWEHPSNAARTFVDARTAYYVAWQPLSGLMGPTFASFASKKEAETFVEADGGELLRFSDVTAELTSMLGYGCPVKGSPAFALAKNCVKPSHSADPPPATRGNRPDLLHSANSASPENDPAQGSGR
jgi:copper chaperone NosL